jgi:carbonic anhydrase/acetyltransferase-like protein (isoleucine patch superfamily)
MIRRYKNILPNVDSKAWVARTSEVIGMVDLAADVNVWYGVVIRGDMNHIKIGAGTNVQDNAVVHVDATHPCMIGEEVTIGHGAIIHGCTIGNRVLVGMGAIILDGAVIEDNVIIGAGALVPQGKRIPSGSLVVGSPCRIVREITDEERAHLLHSSRIYVEFSKEHAAAEREAEIDEE